MKRWRNERYIEVITIMMEHLQPEEITFAEEFGSTVNQIIDAALGDGIHPETGAIVPFPNWYFGDSDRTLMQLSYVDVEPAAKEVAVTLLTDLLGVVPVYLPTFWQVFDIAITHAIKGVVLGVLLSESGYNLEETYAEGVDDDLAELCATAGGLLDTMLETMEGLGEDYE